jgi:hypothetical protein
MSYPKQPILRTNLHTFFTFLPRVFFGFFQVSSPLLAQDHRKPIKHVMKTAVNKFATLASLQLLQLLHSTLLSFGPVFTIFKGFAAFVQSLQALS